MTELPAEVAEARRVLHHVAPAPFSKARVYTRVLNQRAGSRRPRARVVVVALCLAATSSAMAFGYRWVTLRAVSSPPAAAEVKRSSAVASVPRRHQEAAGTGIPEDPTSQNDPDESKVAAGRETTTATDALPLVRQTNSVRATPPNDRPRTTPAPEAQVRHPPITDPRHDSELSQQVRDYHQAVASIRGNPRLALEKLRDYRQKWPQSAISEEVDLREIEALIALGRHAEAVNAARRFVQRYPSSARAAEMQRIAHENVRATARFD